MRIAVVGAGAVGGYCAVRLCQAGHEVQVVDLGTHLAAIQAGGLRLVTRTEDVLVRLRATDNPAEIGEVDLIIVSVQSQDTVAIADTLWPLISEQTLVIPLQNNVDNPDTLAVALGGDHVLAAAIFIASSRPEPGAIRQLAEQVEIYLGEREGQDSERVRAVVEFFNSANLPAVATRDVRTEMWTKFAFVIGFYLTGPLRSSAGEILDLEETRRLHLRLVQEVIAVASSRGIVLDGKKLAEIVQATRRYGNYIPSSVQEIDEGRADESEHMLRTVIRIGEEAGIQTPTAEVVLAFTRFFNQRNKRARADVSGTREPRRD